MIPRNDERRRGKDRRQTVDRRGAVTVEIDGQVVIRPRKDLARFDDEPANVSAFIIDDQHRNAGKESPMIGLLAGALAAGLAWAGARWIMDDPEDRERSARRARKLIDAIEERERL